MNIQLSDHFTYRRLIRFTISTVLMLICTSMYSIVDGLFVSNYVGKMPFAATNLIWPVSMGIAAIRGFRLFSFSFLIMGINIWASSFFTALNNGFVSAVISF